MTAALSAFGVTVRRGTATLLDSVDVHLQHGEVMTVVGPNGAGKSTLLATLAGDLIPDTGTIRLGSEDIASIPIPELARRRAVLPQSTFLQFGFTGREVVAMGRTPLPVANRDHDDIAIDTALADTDTGHLAHRRYPTFSGGEQTRTSLARVLAQETPILLLDEPTAALDIRHQVLVMRAARDLADRGCSVLAILHDLNLAMTFAHRVCVMAAGRVVACASPDIVADADLLSGVFDHPLIVARHPTTSTPLILPA